MHKIILFKFLYSFKQKLFINLLDSMLDQWSNRHVFVELRIFLDPLVICFWEKSGYVIPRFFNPTKTCQIIVVIFLLLLFIMWSVLVCSSGDGQTPPGPLQAPPSRAWCARSVDDGCREKTTSGRTFAFTREKNRMRALCVYIDLGIRVIFTNTWKNMPKIFHYFK